MRGTYDEGRPAFAPGVYINGFYESWPITYAEDAYGLARVGQTIVNLADAAALELFVDDEPLFLPTARLTEYARILDMRDGTVTRDLVWATAVGQERAGPVAPTGLTGAPPPRGRVVRGHARPRRAGRHQVPDQQPGAGLHP